LDDNHIGQENLYVYFVVQLANETKRQQLQTC